MIVCSRSECQTSSGCAHRGPHFELCWFPSTAADIRGAVVAERERCARVAENYLSLSNLGTNTYYNGRSLPAVIRAEPKDNSDESH